ncbi:hypothetical protein MNV49_007211 [Pseudohyphozyma bogoriensis]|nr:hypothetical protein MNV49_007211 [Pseudohyphozyma bogoriensis]
MANQLPGLDYCRGYSVCDIASALEAFAWLSWITLTFQLVVLLFTGVREHTRGRPSVWTEPWSISGAGEPAANNNTAMKEAPAPTSV